MLSSSWANYIIAWVLSTSPQALPVSMNEYLCMVEAVHYETRGEGELGKVAAANVIQRRVEDSRYFPNTICENIVEASAFEYRDRQLRLSNIVLDNPISRKSFLESAQIALKAVNGDLPNIVNGADHFYNPDLSDPYWAEDALTGIKINHHAYLNLYNPDGINLDG